MRLQDRPGWCSLAAVQNALRCLGIRVPQRALAACMDYAADSNEGEIIRGLLAHGCMVDEYTSDVPRDATGWLVGSLATVGPVILAVDDCTHWCTAVGLCGGRIVVFDPSNGTKARTDNGVRVYSSRSLRTRWRDTDGVYYGIAVSRK